MPKIRPERETGRFEIYPNNIRDNMTSQQDSQGNTTPNRNTTVIFTINDLIKDAQRIGEFRGDGSYALVSFLREVDTILPMFNDHPNIKVYVFQRIIINKIQGAALEVIQTLGSGATWEEIKQELVNNFGVQKSYHQLYHEAFSARNYQVRDYYNILKIILSQLNEKYEHDIKKPNEFNPKTNESLILKTFLDNIDPNLASIVLNRNVKTLREAYSTLENLGLIREHRKTKFNNIQMKQINVNKMQCYPRQGNNNNVRNNNFGQFKYNYSNNQRQQDNSTRNNNSGQFRYNYSNDQAQLRQNNANNFRQTPFGNRSNQYRRYNTTTVHRSEPMDVDHIQQEVNFLSTPRKHTYQ